MKSSSGARRTLGAIVALGVLSLGALAPVSASGQSVSINPSGITGGGGLSTGSRFAVNGSIGQAEATVTPLTGSRFAVTGGLHAWVVVIQTPGAPTLSITLGTGTITLFWDADGHSYVIEETSVIGPDAIWTTAATPSGNSVTLSPSAGAVFYRLRRFISP